MEAPVEQWDVESEADAPGYARLCEKTLERMSKGTLGQLLTQIIHDA